MQILFVTSRVPGRHFRGDQLRAFHHLVQLGKRHDITLLAVDPLGDGVQIDPQLRALCRQIVVVPHSALQMAFHALRGLGSGLPFQSEAYNAQPIRSAFDRLCEQTRFDLIHLQLIRMGSLASRAPDIPVVMDFVDALSVNMARRSAKERGVSSVIAGLEAKRLRTYERAMVKNLAATTISSHLDWAEIAPTTRCAQVNNGVDIDRFAFVENNRASHEIVFVGNLGYFPNIDAIHWFVRGVWPALLRQFPTIRLKLVGARPAASVAALARETANVELIGPVPEVHPYLAAATIAIAPLRVGSGQQLKILEAMASGTPVVATDVAASSLRAINDENLLVAIDENSMICHIKELLCSDLRRVKQARAARNWVEQQYTWAQSAASLEAIWIDAADNHPAATR